MMRFGSVFLCSLALFCLGLEHRLVPSDNEPSGNELPGGDLIATFSIAAVDPENGVCGAAVASKFPGVGTVVAHVRAGVGAFCTQHYDRRQWAPKVLDLVAEGKLPEEVLAEMLKADKAPGQRQLGLIDMKGQSAQRNPVAAGPNSNYWGGASGRFYVCQGNTLTGREVVAAMGKAYEETSGSLADRLMAALLAADCAGGDHRGRLGAGIRVCKKDVEGYWLDLHVDRSKDAVIELAQKYAELKHDAKGDWPGGKAPFKHPCPDRPVPRAPAKS